MFSNSFCLHNLCKSNIVSFTCSLYGDKICSIFYQHKNNDEHKKIKNYDDFLLAKAISAISNLVSLITIIKSYKRNTGMPDIGIYHILK